MSLMFKDEVYAIMSAAMTVHSELGSGFLEAVYQEALEIELNERHIPFQAQQMLTIHYKNHPLKKHYVADLICFETIVVELKALEQLTTREESQLLNYLKATHFPIGLLINFGSVGKIEWKRFAYTSSKHLLKESDVPYLID